MNITILNFKRTGVQSVIETLGLKDGLHSFHEITMTDFFSDELYYCLKVLEAAGGGGNYGF